MRMTQFHIIVKFYIIFSKLLDLVSSKTATIES